MGQILLVILILMMSIFGSNGFGDVNIRAMSNKNHLIDNNVYKLDLDGDGSKEKILEKSFMKDEEKFCTQLYINDKIVKEYISDNNIKIYLKDFNKVDNKREICIEKGDNKEDITTEILFYNKEKLETYEIKGQVSSYDNKNGLIKIEHTDLEETSFKSFKNIIGSDEIYIKSSYKRIYNGAIEYKDKSKIYLAYESANEEFSVINELKGFESIENKGRSVNLKDGDRVNIISLTKVGKNKYIKVKYNNEFWWIECGDTQLFKQ